MLWDLLDAVIVILIPEAVHPTTPSLGFQTNEATGLDGGIGHTALVFIGVDYSKERETLC